MDASHGGAPKCKRLNRGDGVVSYSVPCVEVGWGLADLTLGLPCLNLVLFYMPCSTLATTSGAERLLLGCVPKVQPCKGNRGDVQLPAFSSSLT